MNNTKGEPMKENITEKYIFNSKDKRSMLNKIPILVNHRVIK